MYDKNNGKSSFVQEMNAVILQYQLEKIKKNDNNYLTSRQHFKKQREAKDILIDLDNDLEKSQISQEDIFIGRWSNYRVPEKIQQRLSLNKRSKKFVLDDRQFLRYHPDQEKNSFHYNCQSQKTIPKLKVILHQLEQPLNIPPKHKNRINSNQGSKKMKNHFGRQALVISNKQEIRPSVKSQRKGFSTIDSMVSGIQNKRPQSNNDSVTAKNSTGNYQKIKRQFFGFTHHQDKQIHCQKQILSQLLKGKCGIPTPETTPLANMLDYFTQASDKKKKTTTSLGLDRLLT